MPGVVTGEREGESGRGPGGDEEAEEGAVDAVLRKYPELTRETVVAVLQYSTP